VFLLSFIAQVTTASTAEFWYALQKHPRFNMVRSGMNPSKPQASEIGDSDIRGLLSGDRKYFRKVYDAYYNLAVYVCRRCGLSEQNIDEIVQDAFLKLFTNLPTLRATLQTSSQLRAWIATTCRNGAIDYIRRNKKLSFGDDAVLGAGEQQHDPNEHSYLRELEFKITADFIQEVIQEPGGDTFVMFYRDGKTAREIAAEKNEAISTVTTRLTRLRRKFADALKNRIETLRSNTGNRIN